MFVYYTFGIDNGFNSNENVYGLDETGIGERHQISN